MSLILRMLAAATARGELVAIVDALDMLDVASLDAAYAILAEGTPLYRSTLPEADREALRPWFLLTNRPVLAVVNIDESQLDRAEEIAAPIRAELGEHADGDAASAQVGS